MFKGCFMNETAIDFAWSLIKGVHHYRWLHQPFYGLPQKQQSLYIVKIVTQFQIYLTMINFHHSSWKIVLKERVMSWTLNVKRSFYECSKKYA
jgi:hypothetical protein